MDEVLMMINTIFAFIAIVISIVALYYSRRASKFRHVDAVTLTQSRDSSPGQIILYNDGDNTVSVPSIGILVGNRFVIDRKRPHQWTLLSAGGSLAVRPGEFEEFAAPRVPVGVGILGPAARITDSAGRDWLVTSFLQREIQSAPSAPRRRDLWFERRKWWQRVDGGLGSRAIRFQNRHPGWLPLLPWLMSFAWGWRIGPPDGSMHPIGAPRGWLYVYEGWDYYDPNRDEVEGGRMVE